jgi:hypothetical protein
MSIYTARAVARASSSRLLLTLTLGLAACGRPSAPSASETESARTSTKSSSGASAPSWCGGRVAQLAPRVQAAGGWLAYSETAPNGPERGHTLRKHVNVDLAFLAHRLATERISAASMYRDAATAEAFLDDELARDASRIARWLATPRPTRGGSGALDAWQRLVLGGTCVDGRCGVSLPRGAADQPPVPQGSATVVLQRECLPDGAGYFVLTSYPDGDAKAALVTSRL